MNFNTLEKKIVKNAFDYGKRHQIEFTQEFAAIKLFEETGEFAQALLVHQKKCRESKFIPNDSSDCKTDALRFFSAKKFFSKGCLSIISTNFFISFEENGRKDTFTSNS